MCRADSDWLNGEDIVYPVTVDPTLTTDQDISATSSAFVSSENPNTCYLATTTDNMGSLYVGNISGFGRTESYIKFTSLPELGIADTVVEAKLYLGLKKCELGLICNVKRLIHNWDPYTVTWNNGPYGDGVISDYLNLTEQTDTSVFQEVEITKMVSGWYSGDYENYGLSLSTNKTTACKAWFYSVHYSGYTSNRPIMTVTYRNTLGYEDYWSYTTHDLGEHGTALINNYNGNLVYEHNDASNYSGINGFTISHVYNSAATTQGTGNYGTGWKLNLVQKLVPVTLQNNTSVKYKYTDADGTEHYFVQRTDGSIVDEDGLGYTYNAISVDGLVHKITDKNDNTLMFESSGFLRRITDSNGNIIYLNYSAISGENRLASVTTSSGGDIKLNYDSESRMLTSVVDNVNRTISYQYTDGNLTRIIYPDGRTLYFDYCVGITDVSSSTSWLHGITTPDGKQLRFGNYTKTGKIYTTRIIGSDGSGGAEEYYRYAYNETIVCDRENSSDPLCKSLTYQFDTVGRATCIYDHEQNVYSQTYTEPEGENDIFKSNKTSLSPNGAAYVNNLLTDGTFSGGISNWDTYKNDDSCQISTDTSNKLLTSNTVKITSYNKSVAVIGSSPAITEERTYTLSGYFKTENVVSDNCGAGIEIVTSQRWLYSEFITGTTDSNIDNGFKHISVTFTLGEGESLNRIAAGLYHASGTVWIDSMQLEVGSAANPINLIDNSSFERNSGVGTVPNNYIVHFESVSGDHTAEAYGDALGRDGNYSYRFIGEPEKGKYIQQTVSAYGNAGDAILFGGWTKANSVAGHNGRSYLKMVIRFMYTDGTNEWVNLHYNMHSNGWQCGMKAAVAKKSFNSVEWYIGYYNNCNVAYFDSVFLYRDTSQSYTYDSEGNVVSTSDYANQNSAFEYDGNNNLKKLINPDGTNYEYTYDGKKNLTQAVSSEGIKYNITYDPAGNPLEATVSSTQDTTYPTITTSTSYQNRGNYPEKVTDSRGKETQYTYNTGAGYLTKIRDAAGNETSYDVNELNNRLKSVTVDGTGASVNYLYNTDGSVSKITSPSNTAYNFTYDSFGRRKQSLVGNRLLSNIVYKDNKTALISSIQYGNNQNKTYEYDNNNQLIAERINGAKISGYTYDKRGRLFKFDDLLSNASTKFTYDLIGRTTAVNSSDGQRMSYIYDSNNRVSHSIWSLGNGALDTWYVYGDGTSGKRKNAIYSVNLDARPQLLYTYDPLCRLSSRTINTMSAYVTEYEYLSGNGENSTTSLVSKVINGADTFEYTYDSLGNITEIKKNGTVLESYTYDSLNQLKSVTRNGVTTEYTYSGGNVTQVKTGGTTVKSYTYGDSEWHDLLTVYNGQQITYDSIGNPLTYRDGYSFNWSSGRQLTGVSNGSNSYSYQYDAIGQRISKTVNGTQTQYYWLDGLLRAERTGNSYIRYLYDENGSPYGFLYGGIASGTPYYYIKNLQGDVTGILDSMGNEVVQYTYDEWGKCLSVTGSEASYIGQRNLFRYRGYYYDTETGFYLTGTRYYDPEIGRFINADGYVSTGQGVLGNNMFVYCGNNPIVRLDLTGTRYCAATSISKEQSYERRYACYWQKQVTLEKYNPKPIGSYSKGNVYLVENEDDVCSNFPGDIVVLDQRGPDKNDGVEIRYSFLVSDKNHQREILTLLYEFEEDNPTGWIRTVDSMMIEWDAHNDSYSILSFTPFTETRNRAAHVFFNNCEEGWSYWDHTVGRVLTGK
ncbi:MAG: RHS repeat protein [Clostridia bacterium]|nr:RHS repeat protein [Clostridia bacterium]